MARRLAWLALLAVLVLALDVRAQEAAPVRTLSYATLAPHGSVVVRGIEAWSRELRRRSGGTLQWRVYPGGVQGDEPEVVQKIRTGRLDAGTVTSTGLSLIHRPALVLQLPGTFYRREQLDAARRALGPEIEAGMLAAGFRMLGWADVGRPHIFSRRAIRRPEDFAQAHVWVRSDDLVLPAFYEIVPSHTVVLSVPEVLGALTSRRVDTFLAPPAVALALQWSPHVTHMNDMPLGFLIGGSVISERAFGALTPEQQALVLETAQQFHGLSRRGAERAEREAIAALRTRGITIVEARVADLEPWVEVGRRLRARVGPQIAGPDLLARAAAFGGM
jgi:TRAP-type C4-dicarboxylate transport system substrate-binding protein